MGIVLLMILGFVCGGVCVWFIYEIRRRRVAELGTVQKWVAVLRLFAIAIRLS